MFRLSSNLTSSSFHFIDILKARYLGTYHLAKDTTNAFRTLAYHLDRYYGSNEAKPRSL
jgi:hypothetical protein